MFSETKPTSALSHSMEINGFARVQARKRIWTKQITDFLAKLLYNSYSNVSSDRDN